MSCEHTSRCTGHCCKRFFLPIAPVDLQEEAARIRSGEAMKTGFRPQELLKVADMVVYIETDERGSWYTCKYHDSGTGNCMNYADRPDVCRDYPFYGDPQRQCNYSGCTWDAAVNPVVPESRLTMRIGRIAMDLTRAQETP